MPNVTNPDKYQNSEALDDAILAVWWMLSDFERVRLHGVHISDWPEHLRAQVDAILDAR